MKVITSIFAICWISVEIDAQFIGSRTAQCYNPNKNIGTCISVHDCQTILSVLERSPLRPADSEFVAASKCNGGYGSPPYVCCTRDTGFIESKNNTEYNDHEQRVQRLKPVSVASNTTTNRNSILPTKECGRITFGNKIYGGVDADLFDFPWMVLLEYKKQDGGSATSCAGSLINDRYVLTAAHCVKGQVETVVGQLISIRLGEHDQASAIDCNQSVCNPEAVSVGIDAIIPYELYSDDALNKAHDIALIRLERNINFTEAISPICLPPAVQQMSSPNNAPLIRYTVAGWGHTLNGTKSNIRQKLIVPAVDQVQCALQFGQHNVKILESQLCAGGELNKDSCTGDSGGPLMRYRNYVWVLEGIVSIGFDCGTEGVPGVYTRVVSYVEWIRSNIEA